MLNSSLNNLDSLENVNPHQLLRQNHGQLIVEYILLIFIVVTIATTMSSQLVGRGEGESGVVVNAWVGMLQMVGQDLGD